MTKTRKVNFAITLDAEDYERLEKICTIERRSKSRQIAWIIKHHNTAVSREWERNAINDTIEAREKDKAGRIITPHPSVWGNTATP